MDRSETRSGWVNRSRVRSSKQRWTSRYRIAGPNRRPAAYAVVLGVLALTAVVFGRVTTAGASLATGRAPSAANASRRSRLLVIGDSVVLGTYDQIPRALPGWDVKVDATVSRSTEAGLDALRVDGTEWDVVVVELGANDGGSPAVFRPRVDALLGALAPVPQVVWLTIHEARPYYAGANDVIRGAVAAHPNASVGDWNAAIQPADTGEDGLHLTPAGSAHMANFVALLTLAKAPPTTTTTTTTTSTTTSTSTTTTTTPSSTTASSDMKNQQALATGYERSSPPGSTGGYQVAPWLVALTCLVAAGAGALGWRHIRATRARDRSNPES